MLKLALLSRNTTHLIVAWTDVCGKSVTQFLELHIHFIYYFHSLSVFKSNRQPQQHKTSMTR